MSLVFVCVIRTDVLKSSASSLQSLTVAVSIYDEYLEVLDDLIACIDWHRLEAALGFCGTLEAVYIAFAHASVSGTRNPRELDEDQAGQGLYDLLAPHLPLIRSTGVLRASFLSQSHPLFRCLSNFTP